MRRHRIGRRGGTGTGLDSSVKDSSGKDGRLHFSARACVRSLRVLRGHEAPWPSPSAGRREQPRGVGGRRGTRRHDSRTPQCQRGGGTAALGDGGQRGRGRCHAAGSCRWGCACVCVCGRGGGGAAAGSMLHANATFFLPFQSCAGRVCMSIDLRPEDIACLNSRSAAGHTANPSRRFRQ
jgi:hypothetical protein